ncbi:MAG: GNAT family N-acetyltransferase [Oscillospiraceae bacterium]|nr:GNAT family N-acetyltransferase [Oscillospiraceae bacterium]
MNVRRYRKEDEEKVMKVIEIEGEEWEVNHSQKNAEIYKKALEKCITYVADEDGEICGFSRSMDDHAYEIIVVDLLVTPKHRGRGIGKQLMECLCDEYPEKQVYVMSDVDVYYR